MYDAYAGIVKDLVKLPPYLTGLPAPAAGASADAAVAAAAYVTLSTLFPSQKAFFDLKHAQAGLALHGLDKGYAFGLAVAKKLLEDRKDDPDASDGGYLGSMARGKHRPDPDNPQGYHAPFYGARSKCFAVTDPNRHGLDTPPQPGSTQYRDALRQVRSKGIAPELMGTVPATTSTSSITRRTVDETLKGIFWAYDGAAGLGTPPRLYNQIIREVAMAQANTVAKNARLFALVNVAMADAGILAWDQKYIHDLWRPVVGIREHDPSMGPAAVQGANNIDDDCHTLWLPLGAPKTNSTMMEKNFTPNFPAYPSGHATFGATAFEITRLFYGVTDPGPDNLFKNRDKKDLTFVSDEFNGVNKDNKGTVRPRHVRNFPNGLWQMIEENGRSRVYLGVHWVFDAFAVDNNGDPDLAQNIGGVRLGLNIAEDIFKNGMTKSTVGPRF